MTSVENHIAKIRQFIERTAESLQRSLTNYWPTNEKNDPLECNITLHLAHILLSDRFFAFAEGYYPSEDRRRIDLLGIAPDHSWFLGAEFKQLHSNELVEAMAADVERLTAFWLKTDFSEAIFGSAMAKAATGCQHGYGLVAGLHWVAAKDASSRILNIWDDPERLAEGSAYQKAAERLRSLNAHWMRAATEIRLPTGNRYFLLAAVFPIMRQDQSSRIWLCGP